MVAFYPVYINRSDGRLDANTARGRESNAPLAEQLIQKPNAAGVCDYYRLCPEDDPKYREWSRKLAMLLMREIDSKEPKDRNYILAALPENYRVYEHIKFKIKDGETDSKPASKTHAGGGNDRQDAYLYGHPQGRKKRYRSPAEFFPHLLWLATDETGDSDNCSCKFCSPEELESDIKSKIAAKQAKTDARVKAAEQAKQTAQTTVATSVPVPTSQSIAATPAANAPPAASKKGSPLPPLKSLEHREDSGPNGKFLFRTGEIAWFARGQAWGLGVIIRREMQASTAVYAVQPLSNPSKHPQTVQCRPEQLRPWLAWSPPDCTHQALNPTAQDPNRAFTYDTVDWDGLERGVYGQGIAEVDGSILAVKRAETTFTPFDLISSAPSSTSPQSTESRYYGIYIGGEKIWVGDALRMRMPPDVTDTHILVLHQIIETSNRDNPSRPRITLAGDLYSYQSGFNTPAATIGGPDDTALPARVREDLARRNEITTSSKRAQQMRFTSHWQLKATNITVSISQVKGRWYETTLLYPLLDNADFQKQLGEGNSPDVTAIMNGQGDCNRPFGTVPSSPGGFKAADTKVARREDVFARAVPSDFAISHNSSAGQAQAGPYPQYPQQQQTFTNGGAQYGGSGQRSEFEQFMDYDTTNQGNHGA